MVEESKRKCSDLHLWRYEVRQRMLRGDAQRLHSHISLTLPSLIGNSLI